MSDVLGQLKTTVSVVIPCHNAAAWLEEALGSVREQRNVDVELIVVDDGSTDDSAAIAERFGDPVSRVIRQPQSGASRARNVGTAAATSPFIVFLDADDVLMPGTLAERARALTGSGGDVAYCDWVEWRRHGDGTFREGVARRRLLGSRPELEILVDAWWPPGALLYRRSLVDQILPWREELPVIQDARFLLDAALAGARFVHSPHTGLRYRAHGNDSLSRRDPRAFLEDCFRSVQDLDRTWTNAAAIDDERRKALVKCYAFLTRSFFPLDRSRHEQTLGRLLELDPHYLPDSPADFRALSRMFGFARAEQIAGWLRPLKRTMPSLLDGPRGARS
jgi:glycosyltransferase involved in cell wall biosynthesis